MATTRKRKTTTTKKAPAAKEALEAALESPPEPEDGADAQGPESASETPTEDVGKLKEELEAARDEAAAAMARVTELQGRLDGDSPTARPGQSGGAVVLTNREAGPPVATVYSGWPATARQCRVIVGQADKDTPSTLWWVVEKLMGKTVDAVALTYMVPGTNETRTVYAYDGDGGATETFITNGGDGGHRLIRAAAEV